jgi:hypothetical protein
MIFFECDADGELLDFLKVSRRNKKHSGTKPEVIKGVVNNPRSLGLVDEDPQSDRPGRMERFQTIETAKSLFLYEDSEGNQLISFVPYLEEWLVARAKINGIDLQALGIPGSGSGLHERLRQDVRKLIPLLNSLTENEDQELLLLEKWIAPWKK